MSVTVTKSDGEVYSININGPDAYNVMKSIAYLIDLCQEGAGLNIQEFQHNENHKSLMLVMREF